MHLLESEKQEKQLLLEAILNANKQPEAAPQQETEFKVMRRHIPWHIKQQQLEEEDRKLYKERGSSYAAPEIKFAEVTKQTLEELEAETGVS